MTSVRHINWYIWDWTSPGVNRHWLGHLLHSQEGPNQCRLTPGLVQSQMYQFMCLTEVMCDEYQCYFRYSGSSYSSNNIRFRSVTWKKGLWKLHFGTAVPVLAYWVQVSVKRIPLFCLSPDASVSVAGKRCGISENGYPEINWTAVITKRFAVLNNGYS